MIPPLPLPQPLSHTPCLPVFTLWWPCRTQHFYLSPVAGERAVVSIPGWCSHGRNCSEPTEGRTRACWAQMCFKQLRTEQLLAPSPSLQVQPAFVTDHWSVCLCKVRAGCFFVNLETNCQVLVLTVFDGLGICLSTQTQVLDCVRCYLRPCFPTWPVQLSTMWNRGSRLDTALLLSWNVISLVLFSWIILLIAAAKWCSCSYAGS